MESNPNVNESEKVEPSDFEKIKSHWAKHKKVYTIGGVLALGFGLGFYLGNRGNSKYYSRLLKDGVRDAVRDGVKNVVETGMRDVVKDGMKSTVTDVVTDVVNHNVGKTVRGAVAHAIKESAVTIIKEVKTVDPTPIKNKDIDDVKKIFDYITDDYVGLKILYDADGNVYTVSK